MHLPKGLARPLCATAPREYVQRARNPERDVTIGGKGLVLAPVYGPPFVRDLEGGRRYATIEDFRNFVKLAYCRSGCTTRAARSASRPTSRSTSATSTCCSRT